MFRVQLKAGLHFKLNNDIYRILKVFANRDIEAEDERFHKTSIFKEQEIIRYLNAGTLCFESTGKNYSVDKDNIKYRADFNDLEANIPSKHLDTAKFKLAVIRPLLGISGRKQSDVEERVIEVNRGLNDPTYAKNILGFSVLKPVSVKSVYRWIKEYMDSNQDNCTLIPSYHRSGGRNNYRFSKEVEDIISEMIDRYYKNSQRLTAIDIFLAVVNKVSELNSSLGYNIKVPSYITIYRYIQNIPESTLILKRLGKRQAKEKFEFIGNGVEVNSVLERVEIDHTPIDILLVDETDLEVIGRPTLTIAIDKFSRMILGFCVTFESPSYSTVMQCLRHVLMDKSYVKEKYPSIKNEWNVFGIPNSIVVDNGMEFHSNALADACFQLGILLQFAPRKTPEWKGSVERYFRSMNMGLVHKMPGTTRSNVKDRGEEDGAKSACIPMSVFLELLHVWMIDVYSQMINKGAGGIPSRIWEENVKLNPISLPNSFEEIPILLGKVQKRVVRNKGIELMGLFYNSLELNRLFSSFTKENKGYAEDFKVKWDPLDISCIYLYDHLISKRWLKVPAVDQKYTQGLSEWEHDIIKKIARKKYGEVDIVALAKAHKYLLDTLDTWYTMVHGSRNKLARIKGIGSATEILQLGEKINVANRISGDSKEQFKNTKFIPVSSSHMENLSHTNNHIHEQDEASTPKNTVTISPGNTMNQIAPDAGNNIIEMPASKSQKPDKKNNKRKQSKKTVSDKTQKVVSNIPQSGFNHFNGMNEEFDAYLDMEPGFDEDFEFKDE